MGIIRGLIVVFLSTLLFFSLLSLSSLFVLSSSLKYDNVKSGLYPLVKNLSGNGQGLFPRNAAGELNTTQAPQNASDILKKYCGDNTSYSFSYNGYSFNVPCNNVNSSNSDAIINQTFDAIVHDFYYKNYNCKFWDCFSTVNPPLFLISEKAQIYWTGKFYLSLLISAILITLLLFSVKKKQNALIITGVLLIFSAIPLLKLEQIIYVIAGQFSSLITSFLGISKTAFIVSLILGILLIAIGISLKFLYPGANEKTKKSN